MPSALTKGNPAEGGGGRRCQSDQTQMLPPCTSLASGLIATETVAELAQTVMGLTLDRPRRAAEGVSGLIDAEVFPEAQHEHRSLSRRQDGECVEETLSLV